MDYTIINLTPDNINTYPAVCFISPQHQAYLSKKEWLIQRFSEGMKIKLLYEDNANKANAFIEYIPGNYAWRAVNAENYMFIHCIWVSPNKTKNKGYGSALIECCEKDATEAGLKGVAVICSSGSFMADKHLFIKKGYKEVQNYGKHSLMVKQFNESKLPELNNTETALTQYQGLHIIYSCQCPWVVRFIDEVKPFLKKMGIEPVVTQLMTAKQAQQAPSVYAVFNLVYNGQLLADHYISTTRFENIMRKLK